MTTRKFGSARIDCAVCGERAYPMESVQFEGKTYHKHCMKCAHCKKKVSIKGLAVIESNIYCKPHFIELFKSQGGKYDNFKSPTSPKKPTPPAATAEKIPAPALSEEPPSEEPPSEEPATEAPIESKAAEPTPEKAEEETSSTPASTPAVQRSSVLKKASGKSDIFKDLKMRNMKSLQKTIEEGGVDVILQEGTDGATPIEFAFKNSNTDAGRYMMNYLKDQIKN